MNLFGKTFPARRTLIALAVAVTGFTTGAYAQTITQVNTALAELYPSISSTSHGVVTVTFNTPTVAGVSGSNAATAAELENAIELIAAPSATTISVSGHGSASGLNDPADVAADITVISGSAPVANVTQSMEEGLITGFLTQVSGSSSYLGPVTAAAAAYSNFVHTTLAIDTVETNIITFAIGKAATDLADILVKSLAVTDPSATAQGTLFATEASSANIGNAGNTSLIALSTAIATADASAITNTPLFEETVETKESTVPTQEGFIEGFTANETPSQLATTATNVINLVPSTFSAASRTNFFMGLILSGSLSDPSALSSIVTGVTTGVMQNYALTATASASAASLDDAARATLTSDLITATGTTTYVNTIAAAAVGTLSDAQDDVFAFTTTLLGNTTVKNNGLIPTVAQALANTFSPGNLTDPTTPGQAEIAAITQAAIKADPTGAGTIAADVANRILTSGSTNSALVAFAGNFITAVDTKSSAFSTISAAERANAAIGLISTYNSSIAGLAAAVSGSAVATYDSTPTDLNDVAQPILDYSGTTNAALTETMAAAISQINGQYVNGAATITYNPAYLAAQLILAAKTGNVDDFPLADLIALGVAGSSSVLSDGYSGSVNTFLSTFAGYMNATNSLPFLSSVATYLASTSPYTDTQIASDFSATGAAPLESGTLAAILTGSNEADATKIAYAAANGTGVTTDAAREVVGEDVLKEVQLLVTDGDAAATAVGVAAVGISGSVGTLITGTTSAGVTDKAAFAEALVKLDSNVTDDDAIALNVAQSLPSIDPNLITDFATIAKDEISGNSALKANAAAVVALVNSEIGYTGALSSDPGTLGAQNIAEIAGAVEKDESGVTGISNALADQLIPEVTGTSGAPNTSTAVNIALWFTTALPASYVTISDSTAALDSTIAVDGSNLTLAILSGLGSTAAKTDAPTVALNIATYAHGGLTAPEAEAIADTAALDTPGITDANLNLVATNVIGVLDLTSTATAQTALNSIANTISGGLGTPFPTATSSTILTDQENLGAALGKAFPGLDQAAIAYSVANVASLSSSYNNLGLIGGYVFKAGGAPYPSSSTVNSEVGEYITLLTANTNYAEAAGVGKSLATNMTVIYGSTTAASASVSQYLVNQELTDAHGSVTDAESIVSSFGTAFPTTVVEIATQATTESLYSNTLTAEESGSIGATLAATVPVASAATSGSIAVVSVLSVSNTNSLPTFDNALQAVAGVFGSSAVSSSEYQTIATSLGTTAMTGGTYNALHTMTVPSIFAAFASPATLGSSNSASTEENLAEAFLVKFLGSSTGDLNDYENAADIFGVALTKDSYLDTTTIEDALEIKIGTYLANDLTALINDGGPFLLPNGHPMTTVQAAAEVQTLLQEAAADALPAVGNSAYGSITATETPVVPM